MLGVASDERKGVSPLNADENKNGFPMAGIFAFSLFLGLGHYVSLQ